MARELIKPRRRALKIARVFPVLQVGNLPAPSINLTPEPRSPSADAAPKTATCGLEKLMGLSRHPPSSLRSPMPPNAAALQVHKLRMSPRPMSHRRENWFARGFPPPPQRFLKFSHEGADTYSSRQFHATDKGKLHRKGRAQSLRPTACGLRKRDCRSGKGETAHMAPHHLQRPGPVGGVDSHPDTGGGNQDHHHQDRHWVIIIESAILSFKHQTKGEVT